MRHTVGVDSDDITSDEVDALLDDAETVQADRPAGGTEVRLYVGVDAETLAELEEQASAQGRRLDAVAADALRAGAHAS